MTSLQDKVNLAINEIREQISTESMTIPEFYQKLEESFRENGVFRSKLDYDDFIKQGLDKNVKDKLGVMTYQGLQHAHYAIEGSQPSQLMEEDTNKYDTLVSEFGFN